MYKTVGILLMVIMGGCSLTTTVPPVDEYTLTPHIQSLPLKRNGVCGTKTLQVSHIFAADTLQTKQMRYRLAPFKEYSYTQSRWVHTPSDAIVHSVIQSLERSRTFKSVVEYGSKAQSDLLLELRVDDCMQYFNKEVTLSYVKVAIGARLIDKASGKVIASKEFYTKQNTQTLDAKGGVAALNKTLEMLLPQITTFVAGACYDK